MIRTKDEEIEMLQRWYDEAHAESGSYLAMLLTDPLMKYVRGEIKADGSPDIHAELMDTRKKLLMAYENLDWYQQTVGENLDWYQQDRDTVGENLRRADEEIAQLREQVQNVTLERDKLARDLTEMSLKRQEERDHWACKQSALQSQIMLRDISINELKARLWDTHEAQEKAQMLAEYAND